MIKVKNVRPGILIIADAGLKLAPGETVELEKLTKQAEKAVDNGLLARIDSAPDVRPEAKPKAKAPAKAAEVKSDSKKPAVPQKQEEQSQASDDDSNGQPGETGQALRQSSGQGQLVEAADGSK